jgi:hypothetical protein
VLALLSDAAFRGFLAPLALAAPPTAPLLDVSADVATVVGATDVAVLDGLPEAVVSPVLPRNSGESPLGTAAVVILADVVPRAA